MKQFAIAVVAALSLLTGPVAASLAAPPSGGFFDETCEDAEDASAKKKDFTCDYE